MSAVTDEFAAVLLARKVITPEQLVEAWRRGGWRKIPLEDALVQLGYVTRVQIETARAPWDALLVREQILTAGQLDEAHRIAHQTGARLVAALVKLGHATEAQVTRAIAEYNGFQFIDLTEITVPPAVVELIPESVARENVVLPLAAEGGTLTVVMAEPNHDVIQKLEFILNRNIRPALAVREQIVEAITRHYGQSETVSIDSMLAEFTDTAIDFTETEGSIYDLRSPPRRETSLDLVSGMASASAEKPAPVDRRATVRYYSRMNPERMFPLLVILSRAEVEEVVKRGVRQASSAAFAVAEGSLVEIEPILPGCACHPPLERVRVVEDQVSVTFWVVPAVTGKVMQARVVVRQDGDALAEVPLEICVVRQGVTRLMGALSLILPFVLLVLRQYGLDFETQAKEGFGLYAQLAGWVVHHLTPEVLTVALLAATLGLYLWLRPRRREVFWDVKTRPTSVPAIEPDTPTARPDADELYERAKRAFARNDGREGERLLGELLAAKPLHTEALLCLARRRERADKHRTALELYERALNTGRCGASDYFRASLLASWTDDVPRALDIMKRAEATLSAKEMRGPLWYNMGCFAARLGRFPDALRYLNLAVDAGFDDPEKYRDDPDLEPLRWRPGFRQLLAEMAR